MDNFDEYLLVFSASVAIPKGEKIELHHTLEHLTKRLTTSGHEKFLVGNTSIRAEHTAKYEISEPF